MVNSRFTLDVLADVAPGVRRRTAVIHNAVRGPAEAEPLRAELHGPLRLLYVGRLSPARARRSRWRPSGSCWREVWRPS
ncbi:hypothetical protein [Blastococcus brunescens]|uniref:Uncharacterized protein n=1 Tax=Blastococcus brunescens TaxID=1564165 RepID=A0ABZ1B5Q5_9ACTN|nr:hypothetical protein [Blastococcus sp. BMG 8361]WRL64714.1 hypothetical protein U6N30_02735 [Blastococcus sp. BMG 8361]